MSIYRSEMFPLLKSLQKSPPNSLMIPYSKNRKVLEAPPRTSFISPNLVKTQIMLVLLEMKNKPSMLAVAYYLNSPKRWQETLNRTKRNLSTQVPHCRTSHNRNSLPISNKDWKRNTLIKLSIRLRSTPSVSKMKKKPKKCKEKQQLCRIYRSNLKMSPCQKTFLQIILKP